MTQEESAMHAARLAEAELLAEHARESFPFAQITLHTEDSKGGPYAYPFVAISYRECCIATCHDIEGWNTLLAFIEEANK